MNQNHTEIKNEIAQTKGCAVNEIKGFELCLHSKGGTFEKGTSVYYFSITDKTHKLKTNSIKYLGSISNQNNCTLGN